MLALSCPLTAEKVTGPSQGSLFCHYLTVVKGQTWESDIGSLVINSGYLMDQDHYKNDVSED